MYKFFILFILLNFQYSFAQTNGISKILETKFNKVLDEQFATNYYKKEKIKLSADQLKNGIFNFETDEIYKVKDKEGKNIGYAYLGATKSKVALFDYVVVFDQNLTISNVKILIYREDHGGEIASKRWLKQFLGFKTTQTVTYKKDIAGISGATISASSLTNAVNNVLKIMGNLYELKLL